MTEIRCSGKLHGVLLDGIWEIKCRSKLCGAGPGIVILHQFDPLTGELIKTLTFREPRIRERQTPSSNERRRYAPTNSNPVRHP